MTEESGRASLAWVIVGLAALAFGGYLLWYGLRHRIDDEPLMIAAGVIPLAVVSLGVYAWRVAHPLAAGVIAVAVLSATGLYAIYRYGEITTTERARLAEREWTRVALPVCEASRALPEAPPYAPPAPGQTVSVHVFDSVYGDDRPLQWLPWARDDYPNGWFQTGLPALVACLRNSYTVVDTRWYTGAGGQRTFVAARRHVYELELVETRTRRVVFQTRLEGDAPGPLPESFTTGPGGAPRDQDGARIRPSAVAEVLRPYVAP